MSRPISLTALAELFRRESPEAILYLVTLEHPDWAAPIRLVNNTVDVVSNGETFTAFPMDLTLPDETPDREASMKLRVCNVDLQIISVLDALSTKPTGTFAIVLSGAPDSLLLPQSEFELSDYSFDKHTVEGTLAYEDILNEPIPAGIFSPSEFPGLF